MFTSTGSYRTEDAQCWRDWCTNRWSVFPSAHKSLGFGTLLSLTEANANAGSENELDSEEAYKHISVLKGLGQYVILLLCDAKMGLIRIYRALMPDVRRLRDQLHPSSTDRGDGRSIRFNGHNYDTNCKPQLYPLWSLRYR